MKRSGVLTLAPEVEMYERDPAVNMERSGKWRSRS